MVALLPPALLALVVAPSPHAPHLTRCRRPSFARMVEMEDVAAASEAAVSAASEMSAAASDAARDIIAKTPEVMADVSDAAVSAATAAAPYVDGAAEAAKAAAPVVQGAASLAGTAATIGFQVTKKGVEIAAPVVGEGVKAAIPVVSEGIRAASGVFDPASASVAVEPRPIDVGAALSSPFALALANATPYALAALAAYFAGMFVLQRVKETIGPLVYPAIGVLGLGVATTAAIKLNIIVIDPTPLLLPAAGVAIMGAAGAAAISNLSSDGKAAEKSDGA